MSAITKADKTIALKDRRKRIIRLFRWLAWDYALEGGQRKVLGKQYVEQRLEARNRARARRFTEEAIALGGVLIKLGQFFSVRYDLLPAVWIEELVRLQDSVPPVDFSEIRPIIEEDLGGRIEDLFAEFNQSPLASASLGQVHEARLLDGTRVAVKVRRPNIDTIIAVDLEALNRVIDFVGKRTALGKLADLKGIAREFEVTLLRELDYIKEAESAARFRENLKNLRHVYVPKVHQECSSLRVITTEFIEGYKITDFEGIARAGIDRHRTARILTNCYLNQFFIDGFFHADPHPGNLFVRQGPYGVEVVFIDFGMVGELTLDNRVQLRRMSIAILQRDIDTVVDCFRALKFVRTDEELDKIRIAATYFINAFLGRNLGELSQVNYFSIFQDLAFLFYSQPLYMPADFSFLFRAVSTLVGISTGLSTEIDLAKETRPFMQRLAAQELGSTQALQTITNIAEVLSNVPGGDTLVSFLKSPAGDQIRSELLLTLSLPRTLNRTLDNLEAGRLQVQVQSREISQSNERVVRSNKQLLSGFLGGSFLISTVILLSNPAAPLWALIMCILGLVFFIWRIFSLK
jgi:predicted unusual protein kinase regulating ubiquinone biosynthesis (AarF/ABC1/UbiB family)